jgi:hypothetical protein
MSDSHSSALQLSSQPTRTHTQIHVFSPPYLTDAGGGEGCEGAVGVQLGALLESTADGGGAKGGLQFACCGSTVGLQ